MAKELTRENLEGMTVKELRRLCVDNLQLPGMTKKRKDVIIDGILLAETNPDIPEPLQGVAFDGHSVMTKPDAKFGQKTTTTIRVTCGASTGAFPVEGKTVAYIGDFLREVLNVDKLSTGLVNGKEVPGDYKLEEGDSLEFMKPAGRKGC